MTQEEIIKKAYEVYPDKQDTYHSYKFLSFNDIQKWLREAYIKGLTEQLESYLPSNLDEAAEEYNESESWRWEAPMYPHREAFKTGAEWMAAQGTSYNTEIGWIDGPTVLDWPDNILDGFKMGDKVIVQIRKK